MGVDPVTLTMLASAAATIGGGMMNQKAQNATQEAIWRENNNATNSTLANQMATKTAENARQAELYSQGKAAAQASTDAATADNVMNNTQSETARIMSDNNSQIDKRLAGGEFNIDPSLLNGAPSIITNKAADVAKKSEANAREVGSQSANLQAPSSAFATLGQVLAQQGNKINVSNNFARGSANLLPAEMNAGIVTPRNIKPASQTLGTVLQGLGQVGMMAAGSGAVGNMFAPSAVAGAPVATTTATMGSTAGLPYSYGKPMTQNVFAV